MGLWFITLLVQTATAQQPGHFTQYRANHLVINPAFAGAHEALSVTLLYRSQWSGLEGAPRTMTFSGHSLFKNDRLGVGINIINDRIGIHQNLSVNGNFAYHLQINEHAVLSAGLLVGINHKQTDFNSLSGQIQVNMDPFITEGNLSESTMDIGAGLYYRHHRLHLGVSAPRILTPKSQVTDSLAIVLNHRHYFVFSKYQLPIKSNITLQPGFLLKHVPNLPLGFDISIDAIFNQVLLAGLTYRISESVDLMLQAKVTPQLSLGYSFDHPIDEVSDLSSSSHEFMLNYLFSFTRTQVKNPR